MTSYVEYSSQLDITIRGVLLADPGHLKDVLGRVAVAYHDVASRVEITCHEEEKDGSAMIMMQVTYRTGGGIVIGALRRGPGATTKFHS